MSWDKTFREPIALPDGRALVSLRDAGRFISALPATEVQAQEWQTAIHVLIEAADHAGPVSFARLGMAQALDRRVEKAFDPSRKRAHWRNAGGR